MLLSLRGIICAAITRQKKSGHSLRNKFYPFTIFVVSIIRFYRQLFASQITVHVFFIDLRYRSRVSWDRDQISRVIPGGQCLSQDIRGESGLNLGRIARVCVRVDVAGSAGRISLTYCVSRLRYRYLKVLLPCVLEGLYENLKLWHPRPREMASIRVMKWMRHVILMRRCFILLV